MLGERLPPPSPGKMPACLENFQTIVASPPLLPEPPLCCNITLEGVSAVSGYITAAPYYQILCVAVRLLR